MKFSNTLDATQKILLGYYELRGKIQVARLLCQYTRIAYVNVFFTPPSWEKFKVTQNLGSIFEQLPFLKDKNFIVNEPYPISYYIIKKANRQDLLGKTIQDQSMVDMFIWKAQIASMIISQFVRLKNQNSRQMSQKMDVFWDKKLKNKMELAQKHCKQNLYLGYLTLIDFYIYQMMILMHYFYPHKVFSFPKINTVYKTVANIPEIRQYQLSERVVRNFDPIQYYNKWTQCRNR